MIKNKVTLLFDGNNFFHKTMHVIPREDKKAILLESDAEFQVYVQKLCLDFAAEIRRFEKITERVVFLIDSSSWRKDFFPKARYKGNRKPSKEINWNRFYDAIREFSKILESKGVIVNQVTGAEGDDLVFFWSLFLNLKGENTIILSGDKDLMQMVNFNPATESYSLYYSNTFHRIVVYPGFKDWIQNTEKDDVTSIFDMDKLVFGNHVIKESFKELIAKQSVDIIDFDYDHFCFTKVLTGDKGDNIMSVYYYTKGNRTYNVTERQSNIVLAKFEEKHGPFKVMYFYDETYREEIVKILVHELKASKMSYQEISDNLYTNIMVLLLHLKSIPEDIQRNGFKKIEQLYTTDKIEISQITKQKELLKGTKYETFQITPKQFDFFSDGPDTLF